ncbi:hypothetical protein HS041_21395 [Planomonospora sp. ID67723]|uniref:hypothetical protein n=1 Tax=Planomonospora sp. ID67723 TaxID=2738134 RepID=UPI0018C3D369|nr:hypothetical protein [Planomonospora sp. ID67723]MBG0830324.1 hypothetical protein [Planomonospora sp. ID67723]
MKHPAPWLIIGGLLQAAAGVCGALVPPLGFDTRSPVWWTVFLALMHVPQAAGFFLLARSPQAVPSAAGRMGLWTTAMAVAAFVPAELTALVSADAAGTVFAIVTPVAGLGLLVAGAATVRRGHRPGAGRFVPLIAGLYVFVVLIPSLAAFGPVAAVLAIAGWGVCFALLGAAVHERLPEPR